MSEIIPPTTSESLTPAFLVSLLKESKIFYADTKQRAFFRAEAKRIATEVLRSGVNCVCIFGIGYPFYLGKRGRPRQVTEIESLIDAGIEQIAEVGREDFDWLCPNCQKKESLPDLKTLCKKCQETPLKPRDVLKLLPDLDIVIVLALGQNIQEAERAIQEALSKKGWQPSDVDIALSIRNIAAILAGNTKRGTPRPKLPLDIHLMTEDAFRQGIEETSKGNLDFKSSCRSWRIGWQDDQIPLPLDLVFSLEELWAPPDSALRLSIIQARKGLLEHFESPAAFLLALEEKSPRIKRLLATSRAIEYRLLKRLGVTPKSV